MQRVFSNNILPLVASNPTTSYIPTRFLHKDYVIFHAPGMQKMANDLMYSFTNHHSSLGASIGKIDFKSFNDGWPNIFIHDVGELHEKDVIFICNIEKPQDVFVQLSVLTQLSSWRTKSLSIVMPYTPPATNERSSVMGEVVTGATFAKMFSMLNVPHELFLVDLHTYHNLHYFPPQTRPVFLHTAHKIKALVLGFAEEDKNNVSFVFPDEGAFKRYFYTLQPFNMVVCSKIRDGDTRRITVTEGKEHVDGKDLYLVDDLVHSGGTLCNTIKALREQHSPRSINLFLTHAIFENDSHKQFVKLHEEGVITNFYLCDTTNKALELDGHGPFKVLSIADDLAEVIYHNKHLSYEKLCKIKDRKTEDYGLAKNKDYFTCADCTTFNMYTDLVGQQQQQQYQHHLHPQHGASNTAFLGSSPFLPNSLSGHERANTNHNNNHSLHQPPLSQNNSGGMTIHPLVLPKSPICSGRASPSSASRNNGSTNLTSPGSELFGNLPHPAVFTPTTAAEQQQKAAIIPQAECKDPIQ